MSSTRNEKNHRDLDGEERGVVSSSSDKSSSPSPSPPNSEVGAPRAADASFNAASPFRGSGLELIDGDDNAVDAAAASSESSSKKYLSVELIQDDVGPDSRHPSYGDRDEKITSSGTKLASIDDEWIEDADNMAMKRKAKKHDLNKRTQTRPEPVPHTDDDDADPITHTREEIEGETKDDATAEDTAGAIVPSALHIPEAWAVGDNSESPEGGRDGGGVVFVASIVPPMLPWWKVRQNWLHAWATLCFSSAIFLTAYKTNPDYETSWDSFLAAGSSISLALSALASSAHISRNDAISRRFVGSVLEGALSFFIAVGWVFALGEYIQDPSKGLATTWVVQPSGNTEQSINDGSLYFSSWGSTLCAFVLFFFFVGEKRGAVLRRFKIHMNPEDGMGLEYTLRWTLLAFSSWCLIIESKWYRDKICVATGTEDATCDRNIYGIVTGSVGVAVSVFMVLISYLGRDSPLSTTVVGFVMAVNFIFCSGMLCFGYGPATTVGNQFFATWAGVFISLSLFGRGLTEYFRRRDNAPSLADDDTVERLGH